MTSGFIGMLSQIGTERNAYYDILESTKKSELDITEWLQWFLSCFERAVSNIGQTLRAVISKAKFWENPVTNNLNERQSYMNDKLYEGFFGKLNFSKWAKMVKCSQATAIRDIQELVEKGILTKSEAGSRSTTYDLNKDLGYE